jgi:hypothetical protein
MPGQQGAAPADAGAARSNLARARESGGRGVTTATMVAACKTHGGGRPPKPAKCPQLSLRVDAAGTGTLLGKEEAAWKPRHSYPRRPPAIRPGASERFGEWQFPRKVGGLVVFASERTSRAKRCCTPAASSRNVRAPAKSTRGAAHRSRSSAIAVNRKDASSRPICGATSISLRNPCAFGCRRVGTSCRKWPIFGEIDSFEETDAGGEKAGTGSAVSGGRHSLTLSESACTFGLLPFPGSRSAPQFAP